MKTAKIYCRITDETKKLICRLRRSAPRKTLKEIAKVAGCSPCSVRAILLARGLRTKALRGPSILARKICRLRRKYSDMTALEISRRLDCTRESVRQVLKKAGLPTAGRKHCPECENYFWGKGKICDACRNSYPQKYVLKQRGRVTLTCRNCRRKFSRPSSLIRAAKKRGDRNSFCNEKCRYAWERGEGNKRKHLQLRCDNCGETFQRSLKRHNEQRRQGCSHTYCSKACSTQGRRKKFWEGKKVPLPAWLRED